MDADDLMFNPSDPFAGAPHVLADLRALHGLSIDDAPLTASAQVSSARSLMAKPGQVDDPANKVMLEKLRAIDVANHPEIATPRH